jgi:chemotaxis protein MotD
MTLTNAVPAPKVAAPALPKAAGETKAEPKAAAGQQASEDFAGLLSRIKAKADQTEPEAEGLADATVDSKTGVQTRRPAGARSKPLRADDVLPPEMLLTLYPQASPPVQAPPAATALLSAAAVLKGIAPVPEGTAPADNASSPAPRVDAAIKLADAALLATGDNLGKAVSYPGLVPPVLSSAQQQAFSDAVPQAAVQASSNAVAGTLPQTPAAAVLAAAPELAPALQQPLAQAMAPPEARGPRQSASTPQGTADKRTDSTKLDSAKLGDAKPDSAKPASSEALSLSLSTSTDEPDKAPQTAHLEEAKLTITRQETVLPAAGQSPIVQQAAERIIAALQSSDAPTAPQDAALRRDVAADPAPVRILHIQLQPAELGLLTIKLSLRDGGLDIQVEAAEHRTARLLEADRDRLSGLLRSAGYAVDGLSVQVTPSDKSGQAFTSFAGTGNPGQPGPQPGSAQGDAGRGQQSRSRPDDGAGTLSKTEEGENAHSVRPAGGAVYL